MSSSNATPGDDEAMQALYRDALKTQLHFILGVGSSTAAGTSKVRVSDSCLSKGAFFDVDNPPAPVLPTEASHPDEADPTRTTSSHEHSEESAPLSREEKWNAKALPITPVTSLEEAKYMEGRFILLLGHSLSGRTLFALRNALPNEKTESPPLVFLAASGELGATWMAAFTDLVKWEMRGTEKEDPVERMYKRFRQALTLHNDILKAARVKPHTKESEESDFDALMTQLFSSSEEQANAAYVKRALLNQKTSWIDPQVVVLDRLDRMRLDLGEDAFKIFQSVLERLLDECENCRIVATSNGSALYQVLPMLKEEAENPSLDRVYGIDQSLGDDNAIIDALNRRGKTLRIHVDTPKLLRHPAYFALFIQGVASIPEENYETMAQWEEDRFECVSKVIGNRFDHEMTVLKDTEHIGASLNVLRLSYSGVRSAFKNAGLLIPASQLQYELCGVVEIGPEKTVHSRHMLFNYAVGKDLKRLDLPVLHCTQRGYNLEMDVLAYSDRIVEVLNKAIKDLWEEKHEKALHNSNITSDSDITNFIEIKRHTWRLKSSPARFFLKSLYDEAHPGASQVPPSSGESASDESATKLRIPNENEITKKSILRDLRLRKEMLEPGTVPVIFPSDRDGADLVFVLASEETCAPPYLVVNFQCRSKVNFDQTAMGSLRFPFAQNRSTLNTMYATALECNKLLRTLNAANIVGDADMESALKLVCKAYTFLAKLNKLKRAQSSTTIKLNDASKQLLACIEAEFESFQVAGLDIPWMIELTRLSQVGNEVRAQAKRSIKNMLENIRNLLNAYSLPEQSFLKAWAKASTKVFNPEIVKIIDANLKKNGHNALQLANVDLNVRKCNKYEEAAQATTNTQVRTFRKWLEFIKEQIFLIVGRSLGEPNKVSTLKSAAAQMCVEMKELLIDDSAPVCQRIKAWVDALAHFKEAGAKKRRRILMKQLQELKLFIDGAASAIRQTNTTTDAVTETKTAEAPAAETQTMSEAGATTEKVSVVKYGADAAKELNESYNIKEKVLGVLNVVIRYPGTNMSEANRLVPTCETGICKQSFCSMEIHLSQKDIDDAKTCLTGVHDHAWKKLTKEQKKREKSRGSNPAQS